MPPRTQTRPRAKAPARTASRRPAGRRPPRHPLLSPDQRRELSGIALVGLGVLLAVVLALPGGGSIARPVHDTLLGWLGIGAWLTAAGLVLTGARLLGRQAWTGGALAAVGSVLVVVAVLGLFGLLIPGSAGTAGARFSQGIAARLGGAATAALMLLLICAGLVVAVELRVARVAAAVRDWLLNRPDSALDREGAADGASAIPPRRRRAGGEPRRGAGSAALRPASRRGATGRPDLHAALPGSCRYPRGPDAPRRAGGGGRGSGAFHPRVRGERRAPDAGADPRSGGGARRSARGRGGGAHLDASPAPTSWTS